MSQVATTATTATGTTLAPIGASSPLTWETKSGKAREAHSPIAQALAPRAARIPAAQQETLRLMLAGRYAPFLRDLDNALKGNTRKWFVESLNHSLRETRADGVTWVPENPLAGHSDKVTARAVVTTLTELASGDATYKGKSLKAPKLIEALAEVGQAWITTLESGLPE